MLHMRFKLGQCAEKKWRRLRGFDYLTKVITGVKHKDGVEVTEVDLVAACFIVKIPLLAITLWLEDRPKLYS